jgi:type I restriction enzyme S subunit
MTLNKVKLADCCIIKPPKSEAKKLIASDDLVSFVPMKNLGIDTPGLLLDADKKLSDVSGSYTYFKDNDVLLAKITPCFENGKLGVAKGLTNGIGFGSSEFIVFRSKGNVVPEYLYYYLLQQRFRDVGKSIMTGAVGHKRVPKDYIENSEISLPSLETQKQIVAKLDQAFADIEKAKVNAEQNLKNAKELLESYLQQLFSQRSNGWEVKPLESLAKITNGFSFKSGDFSPNNDIKSIKITNVGVKNFVEESDNYLPSKYIEKYSNYKVSSGDLVIALTRTIISNGLKIAVVPESYDGALLNQRVASIQVDESKILKSTLSSYLSTKSSISYVKSTVSELMQPNLSIKDLKAFPIPVPPLSTQLNIEKNIKNLSDRVTELTGIYEDKIQALDELKQSILQKAFNGELV